MVRKMQKVLHIFINDELINFSVYRKASFRITS